MLKYLIPIIIGIILFFILNNKDGFSIGIVRAQLFFDSNNYHLIDANARATDQQIAEMDRWGGPKWEGELDDENFDEKGIQKTSLTSLMFKN